MRIYLLIFLYKLLTSCPTDDINDGGDGDDEQESEEENEDEEDEEEDDDDEDEYSDFKNPDSHEEASDVSQTCLEDASLGVDLASMDDLPDVSTPEATKCSCARLELSFTDICFQRNDKNNNDDTM